MVLIIVKVLAYKKLVKLAITMNNGVNVISLGWLYMCVQIHYCELPYCRSSVYSRRREDLPGS